jgi:hypothetical protein
VGWPVDTVLLAAFVGNSPNAISRPNQAVLVPDGGVSVAAGFAVVAHPVPGAG